MLSFLLVKDSIYQIYCLSLQQQNNNLLNPKSRKGTRIMKIQDVINEIRNSQSGVMSIVLKDASRYAANAEGEMTYAGTLYTKKYAYKRNGDNVIQTGNKETNLTAIERTLNELIGKGEVQVRLLNGKWMNGEIEA